MFMVDCSGHTAQTEYSLDALMTLRISYEFISIMSVQFSTCGHWDIVLMSIKMFPDKLFN